MPKKRLCSIMRDEHISKPCSKQLKTLTISQQQKSILILSIIRSHYICSKNLQNSFNNTNKEQVNVCKANTINLSEIKAIKSALQSLLAYCNITIFQTNHTHKFFKKSLSRQNLFDKQNYETKYSNKTK